jgi:folate-binding protein YgfZ
MQAALLPDRGVVKVTGADAAKFLNGLVTADIAGVAPARPRFAALLTPQGKIIADFIVTRVGADGDFLLDCPRALAAALAERLNFYKLRAKVSIEELSETLAVLAVWGGAAGDAANCYPDPRLPELGARRLLPPETAATAAAELGATLVDAAEYEAHRIALGVPRGGLDYVYGDAFPHETDMDQLRGVDFDKGCYVGQEVVSRVEHRGSTRTRVVPIAYAGAAPEPGAPVLAGDRNVGMLGSTARGRGLASLRLDRVEEALAAGVPLTAGGIELRLIKPDWAHFPFPGAKAAE